MAIEIVEYCREHEPMVREFNERVAAHGVEFRLPPTHASSWLPRQDGAGPYLQYFLVLEDGAHVRGGYTLRHQDIWLAGSCRAAASYQGPISEGVYDKRYAMIGLRMLQHALRNQPFLYSLGMGGSDQPLPRFLVASGWSISLVPFFFKVLNARPFLRNLRIFRRGAAGRILCDVAAFSGISGLVLKAAQAFAARRGTCGDLECVREAVFGSWADEIWHEVRSKCKLITARGQREMNTLFPETDQANIKLRIFSKETGCTAGWAVVRCTQQKDHKQFGNMRLGSIVDCLALEGGECAVVRMATKYLTDTGADLIVSNQVHQAWRKALPSSGYLRGPSNFALAVSPKLAEAVGNLATAMPAIHINRSDGDGPIHL